MAIIRNTSKWWVKPISNQAANHWVFLRLTATVSEMRIAMTSQSKLTTKECSMCQEIKLSDDFYKDKRKSNGLSSRCKDCSKKASMEWKKQNLQKVQESRRKDYQLNKDRYLEYNKQWYENNKDYRKEYYEQNKDAIKEKRKGKDYLLAEMLKGAKYRARDGRLPFDLTIEHMEAIASDFCPVTGELLDWELEFSVEGKRNPMAPSLDKIIPSLGYTQGNVAIIGHRMNTLKSDMTLEQLNQLVNYVCRNT
jgi:hypothetical protein